jgi:two-component system alkaline phosphatase synthesis response regulator PhoP
MAGLLIIGRENKELAELNEELARNGFACSIVPYNDGILDRISTRSPDLVLAEMDGYIPADRMTEIIREIKLRDFRPIIALVSEEMLDSLDSDDSIDDFINRPFDSRELILRIKRLLKKEGKSNSGGIIKCDGLVIDLASCEVTVESRKVELTFKEYELLRFLAGNPGHVFTRNTLLDEIWGIDYFGGDRTVDVHVRRLRSKIEDSGHVYIETVRNIGYRFKKVI